MGTPNPSEAPRPAKATQRLERTRTKNGLSYMTSSADGGQRSREARFGITRRSTKTEKKEKTEKKDEDTYARIPIHNPSCLIIAESLIAPYQPTRKSDNRPVNCRPVSHLPMDPFGRGRLLGLHTGCALVAHWSHFGSTLVALWVHFGCTWPPGCTLVILWLHFG